MRDILFRGMAVEEKAGFKICEWVYGSLIRKTTGAVYISNVGTDEEIEVNPATVGQYTGLKDRGGHRIYEGDIIQDPNGTVASVIWDEEVAFFCTDEILPSFGDLLSDCDLVGNKWENPELLGAIEGEQ